MTTTMDQIKNIRNMYFEQGMNISEIAAATKFNWKTVQKYVDMEDFNEKKKSIEPGITRASKLDEYKPLIDSWLADDKKRKRKQRHTAKRVYSRLKAECHEFSCSYRLVATYVSARKKELKLKKDDGYLPLVHYPGEAQLDFGDADFQENGKLYSGKYLVISFPYSNTGYMQLFYGENMECLLEGMKAIFEHIGGVPTEIWFDNTKTIVTKIIKGGDRILTEKFLRFQQHYRFNAKFMNPESGWEKGSVESKVGYLRKNILVPVPEFNNLTDYNKQLLKECDEDNHRSHYLKEQMISDLFENDVKAMMPLPGIEFDTADHRIEATNKYGQFKLHKGKHIYSASPAFCESAVHIKITSMNVIVLDDNYNELVRHRRLYGDCNQTSMEWLPYLKYIASKPRALRNTEVYNMLPESLKNYMDKCRPTQCGKVMSMIAELTGRSSFDNALKTVDMAAEHQAYDPDSLDSLYRRIFSDVPILPPIAPCSGLRVMVPNIASDIKEYDFFLKGGRQHG